MVLQVWNSSSNTNANNNSSNLNNSNSNNNNSSSTMPTSTATNGATSPSNGEIKTPSKKRGFGLFKSKLMGSSHSSGASSKTYCRACKKKCSGEVLRVNEFFFHSNCFRCKGCAKSLSQGGFFTRDSDYYCANCYQREFGTKCARCLLYVEGEVVTALGKTYHQNCFTCAGCREPFPNGERVTYTGKACLCQKCVRAGKDLETALDDLTNSVADIKTSQVNTSQPPAGFGPANGNGNGSAANKTADDICAGCQEELRDGQALMALDKQYHVWCFKCKTCSALLHGEYMGKDGHPYCERDYQAAFGVKCTYCRRFISGKVLQAGDNNHFHPTCARCTKCGEPFGDGEEMFLQGAAIWHPRCGPGPGPDESGGGVYISNGFEPTSMTNDQVDRQSMASGTHTPYMGFSRASSPGGTLRYGDSSGRFSRSTTHVPGWNYGPTGGVGMYSSSSTYSLRRPIEPGDRVNSLASINHFHVPRSSRRGSTASRYARDGSATPGGHQSRMMMASTDRISSAAHRPISCPPKPGYTHTARSATLPPGMGPGQNYGADNVSQASFRTDYTDGHPHGGIIRGSSTYSSGLYGASRPHYYASGRSTPASATPGRFTGEYKIYPLHMLFTNNYKLPPDVDRCSLERHLSDADFAMAFNMGRNEFEGLPAWKRNDLKRRVKLF